MKTRAPHSGPSSWMAWPCLDAMSISGFFALLRLSHESACMHPLYLVDNPADKSCHCPRCWTVVCKLWSASGHKKRMLSAWLVLVKSLFTKRSCRLIVPWPVWCEVTVCLAIPDSPKCSSQCWQWLQRTIKFSTHLILTALANAWFDTVGPNPI